jgi:hypothetical protein
VDTEEKGANEKQREGCEARFEIHGQKERAQVLEAHIGAHEKRLDHVSKLQTSAADSWFPNRELSTLATDSACGGLVEDH